MRFHCVLGLLLVAGMTACSCTSDDHPPRTGNTQLAEPADVIDEALMVSLLQAKNYHRKAKVYMSDGNLEAATLSVRQILVLQFPSGSAEAEDVRADARALLGKLLIAQGQLDEAMQTVQEGLAENVRDSFFVANLWTVLGEIHDARAQQHVAAGATSNVTEEKHAAIAAYDRSIEINNRLLQQHKLRERR